MKPKLPWRTWRIDGTSKGLLRGIAAYRTKMREITSCDLIGSVLF